MPTLRKRTDVAWIAAALTSASAAPRSRPPPRARTSQAGAAGDDAGTPDRRRDRPRADLDRPGGRRRRGRPAGAAGVAGDATAPQAWQVGERSVLGYRADDGRFCFEFRGLAGGCLRAGTLSDRQPLDVTVDHGPAISASTASRSTA